MYLSHETKLLGLYENMWPIPVVGVNLATSEYMDFPLKMERKILYSRDGEACDSTQLQINMPIASRSGRSRGIKNATGAPKV